MRKQNIFKYDVLDRQTTDITTFDFKKMIENIGFPVFYFVYNKDDNTYDLPVKAYCFLVSSDNIREDFIDVSWKADALFSSTAFKQNDIQPSEKDKVVINKEEYYIRNILYYNAVNKAVDTIHSCMFFSADLIKKNKYIRRQGM